MLFRSGWSPDERIVYGRYWSPERVVMFNTFLCCVLLDTTKSQNKGTTLLYRRFSPRQPVSRSLGLGVQKLEREREVDVGEAPTQRVMGCRAYTTLMKLLHTWDATTYLLAGSRLRRNLGLAGARTNVSSTADTGARRG